MKRIYYLYNLLILLLTLPFYSCQHRLPEQFEQLDVEAPIYPDYCNVTVPCQIAPLNFGLQKAVEDAYAELEGKGCSFMVRYKSETFQIPANQWQKLMESSLDQSIKVKVFIKENKEWKAFRPFHIYVSSDEIDSYLVYRKIAPGGEQWKKMGIYQRNLSSYEEESIIENDQLDHTCMNCHSFANRDPHSFLFHLRQHFSGTYLMKEGRVEKLNTKTPQTLSNLVYPSWHPSGKLVAFSTNVTKQVFHPNNKNRVEVYDEKSDVVVYDVEKHEIFSCPLLFSPDAFETFPTFSADGKTLYFCSAKPQPMPEAYDKVNYSLCSITFDPDTRSFGSEVDTLYSADSQGKSVSFPRVSPDGRYLMYTLSAYGNFSIWHTDADLYMIDLTSGEHRALTEVNSSNVESYHSWSSNSRWFVFSSRRDDGLYTRPYIAHVSTSGQVGKPFMLPQSKRNYYDRLMYSYNIPELVSGEIQLPVRDLKKVALEPGTDLKFVH